MYLKGRFPFDLISTIPFVRLLTGVLERKYLRLLYWLKLFKLALLIHLLLYKNFMKQVRELFQKKINRIIKYDKKKAND